MMKVRDAFDVAAEEPKITSRDEMLERVSQPTVLVPRLPMDTLVSITGLQPQLSNDKRNKRDVMRKHMTRVIAEVMEKDPKVVYIGEDVEHGGYYLVTDGLVKRFKGRVIDFPPDETTLFCKHSQEARKNGRGCCIRPCRAQGEASLQPENRQCCHHHVRWVVSWSQ
jgi:hypothetical protein